MIDSDYKPRMVRWIKRFVPALLLFPACLSAQKFHFQNYNVQQGLIQSQVLAITQDHFDNLWFCTLGGISRFDGKVFTNYSETDGLINNYASTIMADHDSNIWVGTPFGVSRFDGRKFKNIRFGEKTGENAVRSIQEDGLNRIWVLASGKLYQIDQKDKPVRTDITGIYERLTAMQVDKQGVLWVAVMSKGVFRLDKQIWKNEIPLPENNEMGICQKIVFDQTDKNKMYLLTYNSLLSVNQGEIKSLFHADNMGNFTNMYMDRSNRFWLSGTHGLFQYSDSGLISFNPGNGYEGSKTTAIFQDRESNLWFGTNGTGVFRFSSQPFLIYDQFTAGRNAGVMPMLEDHGRLYLGTEGSGLFVLDDKGVNRVPGISEAPSDQSITGLFRGSGNEIYVLASSGLFAKYVNGQVTYMRLGESKGCINSVLPDGEGGFWVASCWGFANISASGKTNHIFSTWSNRILRLSKDSLLVSADGGLYVVGMNNQYRKITDSLLGISSYMSLASLGKYFLLATANRGFIIYNTATGHYRQFTTKDGLNADFIYSVVTDQKNQIWLGTGRGINKLVFDTATEAVQISNLSIPGDISSAECNQSAALLDNNNNLWFGTVSGLFKYFPDSLQKQTYCPPVVLQKVEVFSKEISPQRYSGLMNNWYTIPKDLVLKHNENHLTFSFRCPSYLRSESLLYQYQLEGMEKSYSALTPNHFVVYPALPPGHYTFRARAFLEGVGYSKDNVEFAFDIKAAFYQTLYFKFLMLVLVMGIILWVQWLRIRARDLRNRQIEEVKREENIKVRQTASEDFHDEVGNSLTRIQVLTDVLHTKLGSGHDEEKRLIGQIKENVSGLYQGTRDILWALNPESDFIKEIGQRLESLGIDVYQDTGICFSYENLLGDFQNIKLPGNFNRNIMMIFKEAMSNSLKHAQARHVKLIMQKTELREISITLTDDGTGFNPLFIKKGHGFQNMQKRANRMNAVFGISSNPGEGARYELRIPFTAV
jgi:signal transduction histidine kinase/ligand-binding sensor domain-containing protein